jgi:hypothetical protein
LSPDFCPIIQSILSGSSLPTGCCLKQSIGSALFMPLPPHNQRSDEYQRYPAQEKTASWHDAVFSDSPKTLG